MVVVQYSGRYTSYIKQTSEMKRDMIRFSNDVAIALGVDFPAQVRSVCCSLDL